jgi:hypothetical protein
MIKPAGLVVKGQEPLATLAVPGMIRSFPSLNSIERSRGIRYKLFKTIEHKLNGLCRGQGLESVSLF